LKYFHLFGFPTFIFNLNLAFGDTLVESLLMIFSTSWKKAKHRELGVFIHEFFCSYTNLHCGQDMIWVPLTPKILLDVLLNWIFQG